MARRIFDDAGSCSTIYFGTDDRLSERPIWEFIRFACLDHMRLLYMKNHVSAEAASADNIITVSEQFWDEIREHPIPADLNVVRALVNAPGCLDLYLWLVWRCFKLNRTPRSPCSARMAFVNSSARMITFARAICAEPFCVGWALFRLVGRNARRLLDTTEDPSNCGPPGPSTLPGFAPGHNHTLHFVIADTTNAERAVYHSAFFPRLRVSLF